MRCSLRGGAAAEADDSRRGAVAPDGGVAVGMSVKYNREHEDSKSIGAH